MIEGKVGVLGARGLVGDCLLTKLAEIEQPVIAFSRSMDIHAHSARVDWRQLPESSVNTTYSIPYWICVAPIWVLPDYFPMLESYGVRKIVALSSTSRYTKDNSNDLEERILAKRLTDAELKVQRWAELRGVEWIILRPTLIYDFGKDKNITEIAHFIRRFGFFPLLGEAQGLRQPVHADDVAFACVSALQTCKATNRAYNLSGGEILTYQDMVTRVFHALHKTPHLLHVPLWVFRVAVRVIRCIPRYHNWSTAMADRMNIDLVFEHSEAQHAFGFKPKKFTLTDSELIRSGRIERDGEGCR